MLAIIKNSLLHKKMNYIQRQKKYVLSNYLNARKNVYSYWEG